MNFQGLFGKEYKNRHPCSNETCLLLGVRGVCVQRKESWGWGLRQKEMELSSRATSRARTPCSFLTTINALHPNCKKHLSHRTNWGKRTSVTKFSSLAFLLCFPQQTGLQTSSKQRFISRISAGHAARNNTGSKGTRLASRPRRGAAWRQLRPQNYPMELFTTSLLKESSFLPIKVG